MQCGGFGGRNMMVAVMIDCDDGKGVGDRSSVTGSDDSRWWWRIVIVGCDHGRWIVAVNAGVDGGCCYDCDDGLLWWPMLIVDGGIDDSGCSVCGNDSGW